MNLMFPSAKATSLFSKYRRQFRQVASGLTTLQFPTDVDEGDDTDAGEDVDHVSDLVEVDNATMDDAIEDELVSDKQIEEMGL